MHCPVCGCNSDSKMTNEACFFDFQVCKYNHQISNTEKKAWAEFCKRKAFNRSSNNRMFSFHYTADAFEPGLFVAYTFLFSPTSSSYPYAKTSA